MTRPAITVRDLGKEYVLGTQSHNTLRDQITALFQRKDGSDKGNFWALRNVSFEVPVGDVVGVIGRNGAGKSTLLKILSQITEPTEGEVRIIGRVASLLEVGTGFHPELSGRENVFLNGAILGMTRSEIRRKFDEIVAFSECERFLDTPVKHYSSGMQMRLAFAVAAHLEPEVLLVDEVLAVGDAVFQKKCMGKMNEVAKEGRTVLFVSHNLTAMAALCRSGIYLEKGKLKRTGPIQQVLDAYMEDSMGLADGGGFSTENRSGNGLVEITDFRVDTADGAAVILAGSRLRLSLTYHSKQPGQQVKFWIGVFDGLSSRILALDSSIIPDFPAVPPERGTVTIELPDSWSLHPGRYSVNVAAVVRNETADYLQAVTSFDVEEGDFFGSGKMPYGNCTVLVRQRWTIREDSRELASSTREIAPETTIGANVSSS